MLAKVDCRLLLIVAFVAGLYPSTVAGICGNGDIRLVDGTTRNEGRVEICWNNTWGTVCDDRWSRADAIVACRQLGFSTTGATALGSAAFGQGTGPILLDNVRCNRREQRLIDCPHNGIGIHNCLHSDDAGLRCQGDATNNGQKGEKGEPGIQGEKGHIGPQGPPGPQGDVGNKGQKGDKGDSGIQGEAGVQGPPGPQGVDGNNGQKGEKGEPGIQGRKGDIGPRGPPGLQGADGSDGQNGEKGMEGEQGIRGEKGETGLQGPPGPQGNAGLVGQKGERGDDGTPGLPGPKGSTGPQGPQGSAGLVGQKGERGNDGTPGTSGPRGFTGPQGPPGSTGGRGQKGDPGTPGSRGSTGPKGSRGSTGSRGQKGSRGARGPPGPPGPSGRVREPAGGGGGRLQGPVIPLGSRGPTGGVVYTRWGRTTCPNTTGTQLLYAGRAAGSLYTEQGGGANYLCLPEQPQYSTYTAGTQDARARLYGAEKVGEGANGPLDSVSNHSVPCAVCYTLTRRIVVMIPAQYTCPQSWTREYYGYLMANHNNYHRTMFECVDQSLQSLPGSEADTDGAIFYHTEVKCNGIPCPPYDAQKEVTCVVCTK